MVFGAYYMEAIIVFESPSTFIGRLVSLFTQGPAHVYLVAQGVVFELTPVGPLVLEKRQPIASHRESVPVLLPVSWDEALRKWWWFPSLRPINRVRACLWGITGLGHSANCVTAVQALLVAAGGPYVPGRSPKTLLNNLRKGADNGRTQDRPTEAAGTDAAPAFAG